MSDVQQDSKWHLLAVVFIGTFVVCVSLCTVCPTSQSPAYTDPTRLYHLEEFSNPHDYKDPPAYSGPKSRKFPTESLKNRIRYYTVPEFQLYLLFHQSLNKVIG